ncbi:MAG: hypothetical protein ABFS45_21350, partial [Pseudomonadota bacterium]
HFKTFLLACGRKSPRLIDEPQTGPQSDAAFIYARVVRFDPGLFIDTIRAVGATVFLSAPSIFYCLEYFREQHQA